MTNQNRETAGQPTGGQFASHDRADAAAQLDTHTSVTLPAQELEVLARPMTIGQAEAIMDSDGFVTAVVAIETSRFFGSELSYDDFFDGLVEALIEDVPAVQMSHTVLGASEDGHTLYVRVSTDLREYQASTEMYS